MQQTAVPEFVGFAPEAFAFFRDLATHNNREWFLAHKEQFERACQQPLRALTIALDPSAGSARITRIYRDVRFSKDKSPYHVHISTAVGDHMLRLSANGLMVGIGVVAPEPPVLAKLRAAIAAEPSGKELVRIVAALRKKGLVVESYDALASAPRGFAAEHPRIEFLRMKDLHASRTLEPSVLATARAVRVVERAIDELAPLTRWLRAQVGQLGCH